MEIICLMTLGIGIFGSEFVKLPIFGVEMTYWCMLALVLCYGYKTLWKREVRVRQQDWLLFAFESYACVVVVLSFAGIWQKFGSEKLLVDVRYLPRQAYYLALLPVAFFAAPAKGTDWMDAILQKHGRKLFFAVFILNVLIHKSIFLPITSVFVLCFLSLWDEERDKLDWLSFFLIMLPVCLGETQMTNLLIRFIYGVCFLFRKRSKLVIRGLAAGIWGCVGVCFLAPLFLEPLSRVISDPNTLWRTQFWTDELKLLSESHFLGAGYGTAYCSTDFIDPMTYQPWGDGDPFVATAQYSIYDKVFVTGAHNSLVTVAFRLGLVGILLLAGYLIWLQIRQLKHMDQVSMSSIYAMCAGVVVIALNVGLESPYYAVLFVFAVCQVVYQVKKATLPGGREESTIC